MDNIYLVNARIGISGGLISHFDSEERGLLERGLNRDGGLIELLRYPKKTLMSQKSGKTFSFLKIYVHYKK